MNLKSLSAQVNIALVILITVLIAQLFTARNGLSILSNNQELLIQTQDNVSLIYELERDVIDLQRNLLIYKETASDSSIQRFYSILDSIHLKIEVLSKNIDSGTTHDIDQDMFDNMVGHINDYEENFASVIHARSEKRNAIHYIDEKLNLIFDEIKKINEVSVKEISIKTLFSEIRQAIHSYVIFLNPSDSQILEQKATEMLALLKDDEHQLISIRLVEIRKDFRRLKQLNRGYLYLVNVVMAGSANEFLFLSKNIREQANNNQLDIANKTGLSSDKIQNNFSLVSSLSILIIIIISVYLSRRILTPINVMTGVFKRLSQGEEIDGIPSVARHDEIGDLARAAEIFHQNNQLTKDLLVQSQDMIANQEVLNIQLEQEKERAESAAKSKSMFLANMSHEIRTPMNGIVGLVDLLKKTNVDKQQKNYIDRIAYSGQIMMNVINDILDFSKIEVGKMEIETIEFDINEIIENVISSMQVRVKEKNLNFKILVSPDVPLHLLGDPLRISQILLNLCSNSIKFTDFGSLIVRFDYKEETLLISVCDTGIGMSQKQLDTIFESFTQADGSISRKYGGTGLGLTIVDQLVRLMGGEINVQSKMGEGTQIDVAIICPVRGNEKAAVQMNYDNLCVIPKGTATEWLLNFNEKQSANISVISDHEMKRVVCEDELHKKILFEGLDALSEDCISSALKQHKILGCILDTNETGQKNKLSNLGEVKILEHPFSPKQCLQFFESLYSNHTISKVDEEAIEVAFTLNGHILLVEDNQINQLVAGDMLETLGLTFDSAENGEEAIEKVKNNQYDLVLMDVQMPKMDGYTATQTLRELGFNELVICGLSANALKEDLASAKESGMTDYLTKPLVIESLYNTLSRYLS